ncbi:MFS transporter [Microbacterium capsulatum]|uniref:MFS transporter n=1 Tax=Microbacterium capsulatum TaxID=3041921 RepID=A0ABU0XEH6_9MICO|nr:MFS transporter [Microbacterium sp. ASV81]MDQ4213507.1 MFS transporter [Microbacterium sp. ASV81]
MSSTRTAEEKRYIRKVTTSSFIGNTLEYYDFLVYGTASALAFPTVFFPTGNGFISTLASFGTFAVGFIARPIGGMFFGRRGDRQGRKSTLILTLAIMGLSTFLVGLIPAYSVIGIWAPILLILLRLVQGFAVGGEWGGSMIIVLESAPQNRRGFFSAIPNTGGFSAQILITAVFGLVFLMPKDAQIMWGWRIPFLLAAVMLAVGIYMRRSLHETPVFTEAISTPTELAPTAEKRHDPLLSVFAHDWRALLLILGLRFAEALPYFLLTVFVLSYGPNNLGIPKEQLTWAIFIMAVLAFPAHALFGILSDRIGRRPVYFLGAAVVFLAAFPFFGLLHSGVFVLIVLGYVIVLNLGHNAINAVQPAFFAELFPADRRYSGAAAGREIASIIAGGLTPFIATWLAGPQGTNWPLVAGYVMFGAAITMISVWLAPETFKKNLFLTGSAGEGEGEKVTVA